MASQLSNNLHAKLTARVAKARSLGHEWVQLMRYMRGGNSPRNWTRCRAITARPSLMGRCIGPGNIVGEWRFDVRVDELEAFLKAHARSAE